MSLFIIVLFVLGMDDTYHFEESKTAFKTAEACDVEAQAVAMDRIAMGAKEVWAQCMPIPGVTT